VEVMCDNLEMNAKNWVFSMHEFLSHEEFTRMVVMLWAIWRSRRKAIHEEIFESSLATNSFINTILKDIKILESQNPSVTRSKVSRPAAWIPPPVGFAKINADAAVQWEGDFGAGAVVCRGHSGAFLGASSITFRNISDPTTLEALAVREGLAIAEDLNEQRIQIASDCKIVVNDIKQNSPAEYGAIVHEITERSRAFAACNIIHEFRSSNFEAHNLAKHSLSLGFGRHVWLGQPGDLLFLPVNIMMM
jgi:hypothetical protein